jgi:hypothetical protein
MTIRCGAREAGSSAHAPQADCRHRLASGICSAQQRSDCSESEICGCGRPSSSEAGRRKRSISHLFQIISTYNSFAGLILLIHSVNPQQMVAEIKRFKSPLLVEKNNKATSGPVQSLAKQLPAIQEHLTSGLKTKGFWTHSIVNSFSPTGMQYTN